MEKLTSKFTFTQAKIELLTCPPSGRPAKDGKRWFYDPGTAGLALCVTEGGGKAFYYYRRVPGLRVPKRTKLGNYGEMTIAEARAKASRMNNQLDGGELPVSPREQLAQDNAARAVAPTLGALWVSYRDHHLAGKKPRSIVEFTRLYTAHLSPIEDRRVAEITETDVEALKVKVGEDHGKYTANRVLSLLSAMYRKRGHAFGMPRAWAPTAGVEAFPEAPRDRVLTAEELGRVLKAIEAEENKTIADYFKMLLYTGQRKTSVARMAWDDLNIHGGTWKIPGEKAKNGKPLVVTLIPEALAIIKRRYDDNPADSPFVFPARRKTPAQVAEARRLRAEGKSTREIGEALGLAQTTVMTITAEGYTPKPPGAFDGAGVAWLRILGRAGIDHKTNRTTIHDLRRTFCTAMIERGVPLPIVAAAMGHRTMETTQRHYSMASDKAVADATRESMAGLLADVEKAGKVERKKRGA